MKKSQHTTLPSVKGQVTIPSQIRRKYHIGKDTPLVIEDKGKGVITIKVMRMLDPSDVEVDEGSHGMTLRFKKGVDSQVITDLIDDLDGQS